jgi:hypothetical protein
MSQEPSVRELAAQVQEDVQRLVKAEIALAKGQAAAAAKRAGIGIAAFVVALATLLLVGIALVFTVGFAFTETGMATWLAFLCTTGVFLLLTGLLVAFGALELKKIKPPHAPDLSADIAAIKPGGKAA